MSRESLREHLKLLLDVILAEREAAKKLAVDKMLELTAQKEHLLNQMPQFADGVDHMSRTEKKLSEEIYSENLRNAYFFWSALNWVRQSMGFIGEKIYPESYGGSGSVVKSGHSGTLLSGKV